MLISKLYRASVAQWLERHIGTTTFGKGSRSPKGL